MTQFMSQEELTTHLLSKIGKEIHVGPWMTITQETINRFAEVTGDNQWIHVDVERAQKESPYGTTIAHGYLILSLLPHLTETINPQKPIYPGVKLGINYGLNKVRFPHPIKVGSQVRARTKLSHFDKIEGGLHIVKTVTVEIEGVAKPGCVAETVSRVYF